jgi:heme-degrading monooxygenase HmoA
MFARKVAARLKPNSLTEFTRLIEHEILPWLRKQEGFLDLITLSAPDGTEVATISFWDHEGNAQAFNSSGYPDALEILEELLDAAPYVKTFDVVHSTFRRVTRAPSPKEGNPIQGIDRRALAPTRVKPASESTKSAPRNRTDLPRRKTTQANQLKKEAKQDHEKRTPGNWTQTDQIPDATA